MGRTLSAARWKTMVVGDVMTRWWEGGSLLPRLWNTRTRQMGVPPKVAVWGQTAAALRVPGQRHRECWQWRLWWEGSAYELNELQVHTSTSRMVQYRVMVVKTELWEIRNNLKFPIPKCPEETRVPGGMWHMLMRAQDPLQAHVQSGCSHTWRARVWMSLWCSPVLTSFSLPADFLLLLLESKTENNGDLHLGFLSAFQASTLSLQRSLVLFIWKRRKGRKTTIYNNYNAQLCKEVYLLTEFCWDVTWIFLKNKLFNFPLELYLISLYNLI